MADVNCQPELRMVDALVKVRETVHRVNEHARLWLESKPHVTFSGIVTEVPASFNEPVQESGVIGFPSARRPGPETHCVGIQLVSNIDRPTEKIQPLLFLR